MSDVKKAAAKSLVLISGDEPTLRDHALTDLLFAAEVTKDDFETEMMDGDTSDPATWAASAGTAPFMAVRRTVIVRHLLRRDADLKSTALHGLPPTALVILMADDASGDESRLATRRKNWEKLVVAAGGAVLAPNASGEKAVDELKALAAKQGKQISGPALDTLLEMCGGGFSRAAEELDKLCLYANDEAQIKESDVRAIVVPAREWNVFSMMDGILKNDVASALRQLRILVSNSDKADAAIFGNILPQTLRAVRLLYQARVCHEAQVQPSNASESLAAQFPSKPNICREKPYTQRTYMTAAQNVSLGRIEACFQILADTDAKLKGALPAFSRIETLEMMILEMANRIHRKAPVRSSR